MALSVVDLYTKILPKTNCRDCGYPTCMAFAAMVVSEKKPISGCPHLDPRVAETAQAELDIQHGAEKWTKRDMAEDALKWAGEKAALMAPKELAVRLGGKLLQENNREILELPYFSTIVRIAENDIARKDGKVLTRWEKVFIFNHMAQGGSREPTGVWKGLVEFPNTVSKIKSMVSHVENPLIEAFTGRAGALQKAAYAAGGAPLPASETNADAAFSFLPLPRVPVRFLFWDAAEEEGYGASAKLLFDETITEHLDIESIMFLSERIRQILIEEDAKTGKKE